jgi:acetylornithine aminotransferase
VRRICDERQVTLIFDEVQVGMGRTGRLFAHEHFGITPDIMTLAKALGNGLPIGAMLAKEAIGRTFIPGSHATTFGGTPLVTAVAGAVLRSILNDGWLEHCRRVGTYFKGKLEGLQSKHAIIKEVRGLGLILGVELARPGTPVVDACRREGFLINCTHDTVLRFVPPLVVTEEEIDRLCIALDRILGELEASDWK